MLPKQHIILGLIFATVLLLLFPQIGWTGFLIIILSSVLIDVDHYLFYVWYKKDYSLRRAFEWFVKKGKKQRKLYLQQKKKFSTGFFFLHGIEILLILFLLIFLSEYFLFILVGFSFHLLFDIVWEKVYCNQINRISVIDGFIKFKKLKMLK